MAQYYLILGRFAGRVLRSHAFEHAVKVTAKYVVSEMKLTDLSAKRILLKRKHANHLYLLGKTVFRLNQNDIAPMNDERITRIVRVLEEIEREIETVGKELERRRAIERKKRAGRR